VVEAEGATTVAVSTAVVAGTCGVSYCSQGSGLCRAHRDRGLAVLNLEVVGGNKVTQARVLDVLVQEHCTERGVGSGEVGGSLEGLGLQVDEDSVSVSARSLGRSRAGVVGAIRQSDCTSRSHAGLHRGSTVEGDGVGLGVRETCTVDEPVSSQLGGSRVGANDVGIDHEHGVRLRSAGSGEQRQAAHVVRGDVLGVGGLLDRERGRGADICA